MAELRAQIAELTLQKAAYAGRASCVRRAAWLVPDIVVKICSMPRTRTCHDAVRISICRAAHRQRSCQLALLGLAERAQRARATLRYDGRQRTPCHLSVPRAHRRYSASLGALARCSNLAAANSKLAAQCGASVNAAATTDASLQDGSCPQCTLTPTHAPSRARVSALDAPV
jgi:hypothetical protein